MILVALALVWVFGVGDAPTGRMSELARVYIEEAGGKIRAQNVLTPIVLSLRGFDTFGEIIVLFLATTAVGLLHKENKLQTKRRRIRYVMSTAVSQSGVSILQPLLLIFGAYIFSHGHLDPGGGFQGGVILASGFILWLLVHPDEDFDYSLLGLVELAVGYLVLVMAGLGLALLGSILDLSFLPAGRLGSLLSTGATPLLYVLIGIKVGVEMMKIIANFRD